MKRMKRVLALGMAVLMCMGLTACGKDFDAAGYTKSVLDANYHLFLIFALVTFNILYL